jgi:hypothetical protein
MREILGKAKTVRARSLLCRKIAERIWNPDDLLKGCLL